jgi:hypothetical protein
VVDPAMLSHKVELDRLGRRRRHDFKPGEH